MDLMNVLAAVISLAAIVATTWALAEVVSSPSLPPELRWGWVLAMFILPVVAPVVWFASRAREEHAPLNLLDGPGRNITRGEARALHQELDDYRRRAGTPQ